MLAAETPTHTPQINCGAATVSWRSEELMVLSGLVVAQHSLLSRQISSGLSVLFSHLTADWVQKAKAETRKKM